MTAAPESKGLLWVVSSPFSLAATGQKRALRESFQATACAPKDFTLSPVHHFDPRLSPKVWGPWEG